MKKIAFALLFLVIGFGLAYLTPLSLPSQIVTSPQETKKQYSNEAFGFTFEYPTILTLQTLREHKIILAHGIEYKHQNICDFIGGLPDLDSLVDFQITFDFAHDFRGAVRRAQGEYFIKDFFKNETGEEVNVMEGYIDKVQFGELSGYSVMWGVEGCGSYIYYFPNIDENGTTMIVDRQFITELMPIHSYAEEFKKIPGIIQLEEEEKMFREIMESFASTDSLDQKVLKY